MRPCERVAGSGEEVCLVIGGRENASNILCEELPDAVRSLRCWEAENLSSAASQRRRNAPLLRVGKRTGKALTAGAEEKGGKGSAWQGSKQAGQQHRRQSRSRPAGGNKQALQKGRRGEERTQPRAPSCALPPRLFRPLRREYSTLSCVAAQVERYVVAAERPPAAQHRPSCPTCRCCLLVLLASIPCERGGGGGRQPMSFCSSVGCL